MYLFLVPIYQKKKSDNVCRIPWYISLLRIAP